MIKTMSFNSRVNKELSMEIANKYFDLIKPKECYANIGRLIVNHKFARDFINRDIKVIFGAVKLQDIRIDNLYIKHCFFQIDNKFVDPTLANNDSLNEAKYIIIESMSVQRYLMLMEENNLDTSLGGYGIKLFTKATMNLLKRNILLIG